MSGRQFLREWVGRVLQLCREGNAGSASPGSPPEVSVASGCRRLTQASSCPAVVHCSLCMTDPAPSKGVRSEFGLGASLSFFLNPSFFFSLLSCGSSPMQKVVSPAVPLTRALPISLAIDECSRASSVCHHLWYLFYVGLAS